MAIVESAVAEMSVIIYDLINNSVGDANYAVALADVRVMREELANLEMPELFNGFMREFKRKLLGGDLGGDRREVWFEVRRARLGLLDKAKVEVSDVTEEEAAEVSFN
jgi:ATP-dependent DNA helicase 2 subunit 2